MPSRYGKDMEIPNVQRVTCQRVRRLPVYFVPPSIRNITGVSKRCWFFIDYTVESDYPPRETESNAFTTDRCVKLEGTSLQQSMFDFQYSRGVLVNGKRSIACMESC